MVLVFVPTAILLLGGLGAFAVAYRVWRRGGTWPIWQGAGWVLLVFMLIYLGMSARALATSKNALATTSYKGCVPGNLLELMSGIRPDWVA